jgi:hypothetical protein
MIILLVFVVKLTKAQMSQSESHVSTWSSSQVWSSMSSEKIVQLGGIQTVQKAANQWESFKTTHCLLVFIIYFCILFLFKNK